MHEQSKRQSLSWEKLGEAQDPTSEASWGKALAPLDVGGVPGGSREGESPTGSRVFMPGQLELADNLLF